MGVWVRVCRAASDAGADGTRALQVEHHVPEESASAGSTVLMSAATCGIGCSSLVLFGRGQDDLQAFAGSAPRGPRSAQPSRDRLGPMTRSIRQDDEQGARVARFTSVGVDLSTEDGKTAAVELAWDGQRLELRDPPIFPCSDSAIADLARGGDVVAVDVPLGWPSLWADAVGAHRPGDPFLPDQGEARELTWRATDRWIHEATGKAPQRVAASWLGATAIRGARLAARLASEGWVINPVSDELPPRAFIETYPAGLLAAWFPRWSSDAPEEPASQRAWVLDRLRKQGLNLQGELELVVAIVHVFDALLAAVAAGAARLGMCPGPPEGMRSVAEREGWIRIPVDHGPQTLAARL